MLLTPIGVGGPSKLCSIADWDRDPTRIDEAGFNSNRAEKENRVLAKWTATMLTGQSSARLPNVACIVKNVTYATLPTTRSIVSGEELEMELT